MISKYFLLYRNLNLLTEQNSNLFLMSFFFVLYVQITKEDTHTKYTNILKHVDEKQPFLNMCPSFFKFNSKSNKNNSAKIVNRK